MTIPEHVLSAFQVDGEVASTPDAAWGEAKKFGRIVISQAAPTAAWSGKVRERIADHLEGVHVARPVRATDGRFVVAGFVANEFSPGAPAARVDEAVAAALALERALQQAEVAQELPERDSSDVIAEADRGAWKGHEDARAEGGCVGHVAGLSHTLLSGYAAPVLTDLVPSARLRPRGYSAAVVIVDALLAGAVDPRIVERWSHIPDLVFLAGRALDFRMRMAQHDGTFQNGNARSKFSEVSELLMSR